jgi:hypothetical protein
MLTTMTVIFAEQALILVMVASKVVLEEAEMVAVEVASAMTTTKLFP